MEIPKTDALNEAEDTSALPPFVKSWRQLYWLVFLSLVLTVALMYLFGKAFS